VEPETAIQLTDAVLANLTDHELSGVEYFTFDAAEVQRRTGGGNSPNCKTYPGDYNYPSPLIWGVFDLLTGGALIKTSPIGAVCYSNRPEYNAAKCQAVLAGWTTSELQWVVTIQFAAPYLC